jgi:chromosome segregation ATPase
LSRNNSDFSATRIKTVSARYAGERT